MNNLNIFDSTAIYNYQKITDCIFIKRYLLNEL